MYSRYVNFFYDFTRSMQQQKSMQNYVKPVKTQKGIRALFTNLICLQIGSMLFISQVVFPKSGEHVSVKIQFERSPVCTR